MTNHSSQTGGLWKRPFAAVLCCALALVAGGCQGRSQPQVIVYVAVDRGHAEPILRRFEEETGIKVRAVYDAEAAKTTGLVSRLIAESARPRCDVFWNNEIVQTLLLKQKGLLDTYRPPAAHGIPDAYRDVDGQWTGVAARCRVLVYNTRHVPASDAPRSIFELTQPRWRNRVAVADPQFGTTRTHFAALFATLGPEEAKQYLVQLRDNGVRIVGGNAMVKNLVARAGPGDDAIVVGLTDTDDVRSGQADGDPIEMVLPDQDGIGTLRIPTTVCCLRGAPHANEARRLIDFLVCEEAESLLTANRSGYVPLRESVDVEHAAASRVVPQSAFDTSFDEILDYLESSSRWAAENFHP